MLLWFLQLPDLLSHSVYQQAGWAAEDMVALGTDGHQRTIGDPIHSDEKKRAEGAGLARHKHEQQIGVFGAANNCPSSPLRQRFAEAVENFQIPAFVDQVNGFRVADDFERFIRGLYGQDSGKQR